ncbi:hypothetical protein FA95DRAFT_1499177 [Auriscalpium vulgare]|uniref:Uncharacterized protein n=1 Tax=Auriscalpium vulgare TaxID=40419 RepID=A0ACB8RHJ0_9AGAM|nr:hypothetical protein FA95DRAFT_1499177 [Auriscalpium vulgare]
MERLQEAGQPGWLETLVQDLQDKLDASLCNANAFRREEGRRSDSKRFNAALHVHRRRVAGFHQLVVLFRQGEGAFGSARGDRSVIFEGFRVNRSYFWQAYGW